MMTPEDVLTGEKLLASSDIHPLKREDLAWDIARAIGAGREQEKIHYAAMLSAAIADERETSVKMEQGRYDAIVSAKVAKERATCIQILETMAAEVRKNSPGKEYLLALAIDKLRVASHAG